MDERTFRQYMSAAKQIAGDYGRGYQRGLRRHHHGEKFGTATEHRQWMGLAKDEPRAELGQGYRDGFAGRPPREPAADTTEEATTLNVRGIDANAAERIKRAAAARSMTIGQYLARLVDLHDAMRALADSGEHDQARTELETRGLQTVRA
jgi:hypothetical protein